jgi:DNA-binding CsgD family transcriptional regulator
VRGFVEDGTIQPTVGIERGLLEREHELGQIDVALSAAQAGCGSLVVFEGDPGIGKSRLVREATHRARAIECDVLAARGAELERDFAFGVVLQLFEARLRGMSEGELDKALAGSAGLCGPLFGLGEGSQAGEIPLLHGTFWLSANLTEERPLMLAVDDAHWCDQSSLRFLLYLAQRIDELPMVIVLAARPAEPGAPQELLTGLAHHAATQLLRPKPLSAGAIARLVKDTYADADGEFCEACFEATHGNPFYLRELLDALTAEKVQPQAAAAARVLEIGPSAVAHAIFMRLARMPDAATALARAISVLGDSVALEEAAALAGVQLHEAQGSADALVRARIIERSERLEFSHPVVRSAIYNELTPGERSRAHAAAASLLQGAGAPAKRVAAHLLNTGPVNVGWAVDALRDSAAGETERGAPETAARYLERALAEPVEGETRGQLLLDLARAEATIGDARAADRLNGALEVLASGRERANALYMLGRALYTGGRHQEAGEAIERALEELTDADDETLARELRAAHFAMSIIETSLAPKAIEMMASAVAPTGQPTTPGERALLAQLAMEAVKNGHSAPVARDLALRAWDDGRFIEDDTCDGVIWPLLTWVFRCVDDLDTSDMIARAALEDAHRRGSAVGFATASWSWGTGMIFRGRLREGISMVERAVEARRHGWQMFGVIVQAAAAVGYVDLNELDVAESLVAEVAGVSEETSREYPYLLWARARLRLARGDPEGSLEDWLEAGRALVEHGHTPNPAPIPWRGWAAIAAAQTGSRDLATELTAEELRLAEQFGAARTLGFALRCGGLVFGGPHGIELLERAVDVLAESPSRLEYVRALVDLGALIRSTGRPALARDPLRRGLDLAHELGITALANRARDELVATGARPRQPRLTGTDSLTPSERRVAEMAASGLSNREIAQALFVTVKAVKWHLSNTFRKLDIHERGELATVLGS